MPHNLLTLHERHSEQSKTKQTEGAEARAIRARPQGISGRCEGAIRMFQRDNEMLNIVLTDAEARDKATRHFFHRALREVREAE